MKISNKINSIRRKFMRFLTSKIGRPNTEKIQICDYNNSKIKVLIIRPNHRLGNLLLITPLVQEIENHFKEISIDLFVKGQISTIIFKNYSTVNNHFQLPKKPFNNLINYFFIWFKLLFIKYDLVINIDEYSSSGRIATRIVNSKYKIMGLEEVADKDVLLKNKNISHMAIKPILLFKNFIGSEIIPKERYYPIDLRLNEIELKNGNYLINNIFKNSKKTIAIFTYATGSKMLSKNWWESFYNLLVVNFPQYNILEILPVENTSQIDFVGNSIYSTDIRELSSVIANSSLFIGADSGIMHLAVSSGAPTIGLFSGEFIKKYKPYGGKNIGLDYLEFSQSEIISKIKKILIR